MPIRGGGSPGAIAVLQRRPPTPSSAAASGPTTITSSPSVLITRASAGRRLPDRLDEALDGADRLLVAVLDGQPRVAGEVGERDRHAQPALLERLLAEVGLHVADHVLLDEVRRAGARAGRSMNGAANGSTSRVSPSISSAISTLGTPARISGSCT